MPPAVASIPYSVSNLSIRRPRLQLELRSRPRSGRLLQFPALWKDIVSHEQFNRGSDEDARKTGSEIKSTKQIAVQRKQVCMSEKKTASRPASWRHTREASNAILEKVGAIRWPLEVLVATADADIRRSLADLLAECGLSPVVCSSLGEAQSILVRQPICLVFCDYRLPDGDFRDVLYQVKRSASSIPVVVCNRMGDRREFLNALKSGAFDYIDCTWPRQEIQQIVRQALSMVSLHSLELPTGLREDSRRNP